MKENQIIPNFFVSLCYFILHEGIELKRENSYMWLEEEGVCLFPPVPYGDDADISEYPKIDYIWCDWFQYINPECIKEYSATFLDYEYIYKPDDFLKMEGSSWAVFRKNSRKFPNRYKHEMTSEPKKEEDVYELLGIWLEANMDTEDAEFLVRFAIYPDVPFRQYCYVGNQLVGIISADENYLFWNFRLCVVHPDFPFLSEFLRLKFYTDPVILDSKKYVNDGGSLNKIGLEKFKDKMNPYKKNIRKSWSKKSPS